MNIDDKLRLTPRSERQKLVDFITNDELFCKDIDLSFYMRGVWMARFIKDDLIKKAMLREPDDPQEAIFTLNDIIFVIDTITNEQYERERTRN